MPYSSTKCPLTAGDQYELFSKLEPIFTYTELHFMEEVSVEQISRMTHFNYSYFCWIFKKATGESYIDYLNYVRISVVEELLRTTDLPISVLLERTGFTSLSYFNRVFKSKNSINPSVYRKQMLNSIV